MRHQVAGRKLKRTHSHRKALLSNLATQLFQFKKIHTTEAKAKELKAFAEKLITKAKNALLRERQGLLPDKQTVDIHNRRIVGKIIRNKAVLQELFDSIAPVVENRNGGYTRVIKTGVRRGDNARTAIIELVDFSAPQDGTIGLKKKKKAPVKKSEPKVIAPSTPQNEVIEETVSNLDENIATNEQVEVSNAEPTSEIETVSNETQSESLEETNQEVTNEVDEQSVSNENIVNEENSESEQSEKVKNSDSEEEKKD